MPLVLLLCSDKFEAATPAPRQPTGICLLSMHPGGNFASSPEIKDISEEPANNYQRYIVGECLGWRTTDFEELYGDLGQWTMTKELAREVKVFIYRDTVRVDG